MNDPSSLYFLLQLLRDGCCFDWLGFEWWFQGSKEWHSLDFGDNQLLSRLLMWWRNWRRKWPWILVAVEAVETSWVPLLMWRTCSIKNWRFRRVTSSSENDATRWSSILLSDYLYLHIVVRLLLSAGTVSFLDAIRCKAEEDPKSKFCNSVKWYEMVNPPAGASGIDHKQLVAVANMVHVANRVASDYPYWSEMEVFFGSVSPDGLDFLNKQMTDSFKFREQSSEMLVDENATLCLEEIEGDSKKHESDKAQVSVDSDPLFQGAQGMSRLDRVPSLTQRVLSALIDEDEVEDLYNQNEAPDNCLLDEVSCNRNIASHTQSKQCESSSSQCNESSSNGCLPFPARGDFPVISKEDAGSKFSSKLGTSDISSCSSQYQTLPLDDKIRMELQSIGIPLDSMHCPPLEEKSVDQEIMELQVEREKQGIKKTKILSQIDEAIQRESQEEKKNVEQVAMNLLLITAYKKMMANRGGNSSRKAASKVEGKAKAFANRTLVRYKEYESTGKSCFSEPKLKEVLFSPPCKKDMKSALSTFRRNFSGGYHKKATRRKSYPRYKAKRGASNAGKAAASSGRVQIGDSSSGSKVHLKRSSSVASLKDDSSSGRMKRKNSVSELEVLHAPKATGAVNGKRSSSSRRRGENGSSLTTSSTTGGIILPSAECCRKKCRLNLKNKAEEQEVDHHHGLASESELHEVPISADPAIENLSKTVMSVVATEKAPSSEVSMIRKEKKVGGADELTTLLNVDEEDNMTESDYAGLAVPMDDL